MSRVADDSSNGNLAAAVHDLLFHFPENIERTMFPSGSRTTQETDNNIPVDILDSPKEYIFYMDVPGISKSDIQVTVEDEKTLVIKSGGKRKREEGEGEEGCKYLRLERRAPKKVLRKFRLPEDANVSAITAKCENGVLTVIVEKLPPSSKTKTVRVSIA